MRALVDHYRELTWTYQRAAHEKRTPSSLLDRRTNNVKYLQRSIDTWTSRAFLAQRRALAVIHRRLLVRLPKAPALACPALRPGQLQPAAYAQPAPDLPGARHDERSRAPRRRARRATLRLWQRRSASAALVVSEHEPAIPAAAAGLVPLHPPLRGLLEREHRQRLLRRPPDGPVGSRASTGRSSSSASARPTTGRSGPSSQAAVRAYQSGRGFTPWPNTARVCGLL